MNAIENEQVCKSAIGAITRGAHGLDVIPGLIEKIIDTEAWREREVRPGEVKDAREPTGLRPHVQTNERLRP